MAALERMRSGNVLRLPRGYSMSKRSLAIEAMVNKDTVVARNPDGSFRYPEVNRLLENGFKQPTRMQRLRAENAQLRDEIVRLKRLLAGRSIGLERSA